MELRDELYALRRELDKLKKKVDKLSEDFRGEVDRRKAECNSSLKLKQEVDTAIRESNVSKNVTKPSEAAAKTQHDEKTKADEFAKLCGKHNVKYKGMTQARVALRKVLGLVVAITEDLPDVEDDGDEGGASTAARHFTQSKYCKAGGMRVLAELWNVTDYTFVPSTAQRVQRWMADEGIRDTRAPAGGQQQRMDDGERDEIQDVLDEEEGREGGVREGGVADEADEAVGEPDLPGEEVVMTSRGVGRAGPAPRAPRPDMERARREKRALGEADVKVRDTGREKRARQTTIEEMYDKEKLAKFTDAVTGGAGIPSQRAKVATMVSEVRATFRHTGATILSDGRKSRSGKPLVNFLVGGANGALLYATAARDGSVRDTADIVYRRWRAIILSFPAKDVIGFCTDSAGNYTAAARRFAIDLEPDIRRITWLPCSTHVCNLMLSYIGTQLGWVKDTIIRARALVQFIKSHGAAHTLFRKVSPRVQLVEPVETRFASVFLMLTYLKGRRDALESMLHGDAWARIPWERRLVSQHVLRLMRRVDVPTDMIEPCVCEVAIRNLHMLEPAHAAAHLLNPGRRFLTYYESLQTTADDARVVEECDKFLLARTGGDSVGRLYRTVRNQMRHFHSRRGDWGDRSLSGAEADDCRGDRETERCAAWWFDHGRAHPELRTIAIRVMHLWMSASPTERNWAQQERINTARRVKLGFAKLAQLVEIVTNLKLASCARQGGGYVLPWVMGTGREGTTAEDEDEEGDVEPEDVFGKRATKLRPWPEGGDDADAHVGDDGIDDQWTDDDDASPLNDDIDDQWTNDDDAPLSGDATAERVYFTYGGGRDDMASFTSVITADVPSTGQASGNSRVGGRRGGRSHVEVGVDDSGEQEPRGGLQQTGRHWEVKSDNEAEEEAEDEEVHLPDRHFSPSHHPSTAQPEALRRSERLASTAGRDRTHDGEDRGGERTPSDAGIRPRSPSELRTHDSDVGGLGGGLGDFSAEGRRLQGEFVDEGQDAVTGGGSGGGRRGDGETAGDEGQDVVLGGGSPCGGRGNGETAGDEGQGAAVCGRGEGGPGGDGDTAGETMDWTEMMTTTTKAAPGVAHSGGSPPTVRGGVGGGWSTVRRVGDRLRADYDAGRGVFAGRTPVQTQAAEGGCGRPSLQMAGRMLGLSRAATRRLLVLEAAGTSTDMLRGQQYTSGEEGLLMRPGTRRQRGLSEVEARLATEVTADQAALNAIQREREIEIAARAAEDEDADTESEPIETVARRHRAQVAAAAAAAQAAYLSGAQGTGAGGRGGRRGGPHGRPSSGRDRARSGGR
ncbi:hypothetical protein CBR_g17732 [Chara braunii]|uniref:DUF659 domain-containing protein n=1 Tax=Chara braunii TaxID=69332 RepID=A0A388KVE8_CHABU|nr:hypothetical protein CBR_g17732 [Chara braunii]|eukprot:GBG74021.1 hypothetical protein CBR_g17732 [Chara braunii]